MQLTGSTRYDNGMVGRAALRTAALKMTGAWLDTDATHGRWPRLAAALTGPALAASWRWRDQLLAEGRWVHWLPLPALLLHQTEEWVRPGGFLPWFNRTVMDSGADEWPITRRDGLAINVGLGWGVAAAAAWAGPTRPAISSAQLAMDLANAGLHVSQAARQRRYNPGLATATLLFAPIGIAGIRRLRSTPERRREVATGFAAGIAASAAMMVTMRARVARARRSPAGGHQQADHDPHAPLRVVGRYDPAPCRSSSAG